MESNPVWRRSLRRRQACLPQRPPRKLGPAMRPSTGAVRWSARENSRPRSSTGCQRRVGRIPSPWRESQGEGSGIAGPLGDRSTPSPGPTLTTWGDHERESARLPATASGALWQSLSERKSGSDESDHKVAMRAREVTGNTGAATGRPGQHLSPQQGVVQNMIVLEAAFDIPIA